MSPPGEAPHERGSVNSNAGAVGDRATLGTSIPAKCLADFIRLGLRRIQLERAHKMGPGVGIVARDLCDRPAILELVLIRTGHWWEELRRPRRILCRSSTEVC